MNLKVSKGQGKEIKNLAEKLNIKIVDIAKKMDISDTRVHDMLAGRAGISPKYARSLYGILGEHKSLSYLLEYSISLKVKSQEAKEYEERPSITTKYPFESFYVLNREVTERLLYIFNVYVDYLRLQYKKMGAGAKAGVLSDLEKIADKYRDI